jgi:hypothetical protein
VNVGVEVLAIARELEGRSVMVEVPGQARPLGVAKVEDRRLVRASEVLVVERVALAMV